MRKGLFSDGGSNNIQGVIPYKVKFGALLEDVDVEFFDV